MNELAPRLDAEQADSVERPFERCQLRFPCHERRQATCGSRLEAELHRRDTGDFIRLDWLS